MKLTTAASIAALVLAAAPAANATAVDLITNGNFDSTTYTTNSQFGTGYGGQGVTGWTGGGGYQLFFFAGTAATNSANSQYDNGYNTGSEKLWSIAASPTGGSGNIVALDGDPSVGGGGSIKQTLTGLTVGSDYTVTFDWAAAQLQSRNGATTEKVQVSLGGQSFTTAVVNNASESSTPWVQQSFTYQATSTTEMLNFLSEGTPSGLPPIVALDGISMIAVPEPGSLGLLGAGLGLLGYFRRRK